jgi:lanthanide-dependent methanol dehydrogenase
MTCTTHGWPLKLYKQSTTVALVTALLGVFGAALANDELRAMQNEPGQWVMANGNYAGWNYSPLDQITTTNVDDLQLAWTLQIGVTDSLEAEPLVIGNTMYIVTPKPNTVYALDLAREGVIKWSFAPEMPGLEQANACCGAQTRGLAYAEGKIIFNTLDGQLFAIDAETGAVVWSKKVTNLDITETTTTAPLIVDDNVIIGNEGGERGIRGWVASFDLNTGEQNWKYHNTGPNRGMGIGERFQPFYADDQVENPGVDTWYQDSWKVGGGTSWGWFTYDTELNAFYYGTANCAPWNPDYRRDPATAPGFDVYQNKYCASTIARDAETGEMLWAYSRTPQDQWDFDEPGQHFLIDLTIDGELRKALVIPARNGFFYVHDRATGELLLEPWKYTTVTWAESVDMETGRPNFNDEAVVYTGVESGSICPFIAGNNWFNDAYSPDTGLIYFAAENRCVTYTGEEGEYVPGENYLLVEFGETVTGPGNWQGELQAWNPVTREKVWGLKTEDIRNNKPVLATAGGLILQGTDLGRFRAVDANTGEELWSFRTGSDFRNSPISYTGPDGKQYIAVISSHAPENPEIGEETPPDDAERYFRTGTTMYVFTLP